MADTMFMSREERREQGRVDRLRGMSAEQRFHDIMRNPFGRPSWLYDIRPATREEDEMGVDAFAEIDIGDIPIQIKSSRLSGEAFRLKHSGERIIVIVVNSTVPSDFIRQKTLREIAEHRERFFHEARH